MIDNNGFVHGGVSFPLAPMDAGGPGATMLRDADPATFYVLEFYKSVLNTYLSGRFLAEAASAGADQIAQVVGDTLPLDPSPYLTEGHIQWPLLSACHKNTKYVYIGTHKVAVDRYEISYVLPPMEMGESIRLSSILKSVLSVIDNRTEQGSDASYAPSAPAGAFGDSVWARIGVARAEIIHADYGGFQHTADLFFPAITMTLELEERYEPGRNNVQIFDGADIDVDYEESTGNTIVVDVAQVATHQEPTIISLSPATGTKAGGTAVTITGTQFRVGTLPSVTFGNIAATAVHVVSATSITCLSPAHDAFATFAADVTITNIDGQSATLPAAFTFT